MNDRKIEHSPLAPLLTYLQLVRLPNVFTALADVLLGFLVTHASPVPAPMLGALLASSACLYLSGMALNDVFDCQVDARERPRRPIPSGRVSLRSARWLAWELLAGGILFGLLAAYLRDARFGQLGSLVVAALLALLVVAYNAFLKRTAVGPLAMGGCRTLNVLLGMSAAPWATLHPMQLALAAGLGVYVTGITWFSRSEATASPRPRLILAALVMLAGWGLMASYPRWADAELPAVAQPRYAMSEPARWQLLWIASGAVIALRIGRAIRRPSPERVQYAVKVAILSIIVLDAIACLGVRDITGAIWILPLLVPAMWLGRWVYST